jgi:hypothetical protein
MYGRHSGLFGSSLGFGIFKSCKKNRNRSCAHGSTLGWPSQVERCAGHLGVEMPVRFRFDAREVEIVENVDQWYGPDYCYFKIKGNDGNLYILRFDEGRAEWELTMFQSPGGPIDAPPLNGGCT